MSDSVINSINAIQQAAMSQQVVKTSGAGKAYQSVAQSTAIAVQDAADYLRNLETISATVVGVAAAKMIEEESTVPWASIIQEAQKIVETGAKDFKTVGTNAGDVLKSFPSG